MIYAVHDDSKAVFELAQAFAADERRTRTTRCIEKVLMRTPNREAAVDDQTTKGGGNPANRLQAIHKDIGSRSPLLDA